MITTLLLIIGISTKCFIRITLGPLCNFKKHLWTLTEEGFVNTSSFYRKMFLVLLVGTCIIWNENQITFLPVNVKAQGIFPSLPCPCPKYWGYCPGYWGWGFLNPRVLLANIFWNELTSVYMSKTWTLLSVLIQVQRMTEIIVLILSTSFSSPLRIYWRTKVTEQVPRFAAKRLTGESRAIAPLNYRTQTKDNLIGSKIKSNWRA